MSVTKTCGSSGIHGAAADTVTSWNWVESCVYVRIVRPTWKTAVKWWISLAHSNTPVGPIKSFGKVGGCSHDKLTANKRTMTWCHQNGSNSAFALNHLYLYTHGWPSKLNLSQHDLRLQWKYGKVIILAVCSSHFSASISVYLLSFYVNLEDSVGRSHQNPSIIRCFAWPSRGITASGCSASSGP